MFKDTLTHIAVVYNGTNVLHYVDGNLQTMTSEGTQTGDLTPFNKEVLIGANVDGSGNGISANWKGTIDDLRIYDRALSADEVSALAV